MGDNKILICAPNYVEDTIEPPVVGGGNWESSYPVSNLGAEFFIDTTRSVDATTASTQVEYDLSYPRGVKLVAVPDSNLSKSATWRARGTNTIAWSGITVNGSHSIGATTLNISSSIAVAITAGDIFKIAGDSTVYQVVTGATLPASSTGSIIIKQDANGGIGLTKALTGGESLTCHSGDYSTTVFDTGWEDYRKATVPVGTKVWGAAGVWDGIESDNYYTRMNFPKQGMLLLDSLATCQYVKLEISDTSNTDGYVELSALYITSVYRPKFNMLYGATFYTKSNTTKETSKGGVDAFDTERPQRALEFTLSDIPVSEAFSSIFDTLRELDISGNLFLVYDEDDTDLMIKRSFAGRFEDLSGITTDFYDGTTTTHRILERLA